MTWLRTFFCDALAITCDKYLSVEYVIDLQQSRVSAHISGIAYSHALYRQAEGCIVLVGLAPKPPAVIDAPNAGPTIIGNALPGAGIVKPINSALSLAIGVTPPLARLTRVRWRPEYIWSSVLAEWQPLPLSLWE